jgi:hypothetical protein
VIRPPETPAVCIFFLNWQVNQYMRSAFLGFGLVGENTASLLRNFRGRV